MNKLPRVHAFDDEVSCDFQAGSTLRLVLSARILVLRSHADRDSGRSTHNAVANGMGADITHTRMKV